MLGVDNLWAYVIGTVLIVLLPGPNSLYALSTAARFGVRSGAWAALGIFLGDWILMAATALGAASLMRAYPPVFLVMKYGGAAYLAWIGVGMVVAAVRRWRGRGVAAAVEAAVTPRPLRRALVISLLNPKSILFFVSFFVQFIDPSYAHPELSFLLLASIQQVCSTVYLAGLIIGGTWLATQFRRRRRLASGLTAGTGAVFVGFGVTLATASLG